MKVIGAKAGGYIVEINDYEARRLFGVRPTLDEEYDVHKALESLDTLRTLDTTNIKLAKEQTKKYLTN